METKKDIQSRNAKRMRSWTSLSPPGFVQTFVLATYVS